MLSRPNHAGMIGMQPKTCVATKGHRLVEIAASKRLFGDSLQIQRGIEIRVHTEYVTTVVVNAGNRLQNDVAFVVGVCPVEGELLPVAGDVQALDWQIGKLPLPVPDESQCLVV